MIDTAALREKVLDLAIRGKLVPQDPNDEPASVLLERIHEQKLQMVREGKLKAKDVKDDTIIFKGDDNCYYEKYSDGSVKNIQDEIPFDLPEGWSWSRATSILTLISGQDLTPDKYNSNNIGIPYITGASNFENGHITINRWTEFPQAISIMGDILLTCKGTIGEMAINIIGDTHIARQIMALRGSEYINNGYLELVMQSEISSIIKKADGLIPGISRPVILELLLPIAPSSEQLKIVESTKILLQNVNDINLWSNEIETIKSLIKSKVLELAIQGKLVPQDENDEPASVLLEHIRAERKAKLGKKYVESYIYKGDDNCYYENNNGKVLLVNDFLPFDLPEGWAYVRLENVLNYEQPTEYIVESTDYRNEYKTPVLTAGKSFIIGYTNETTGIKNDLPVIIFDDFTTDSKYVDFPFKVKSSAMKILTADKSLIDTKYAYYIMQTVECDHETHKRYWISEYGRIIIGLPPLNEQLKITSQIEYLFSLLDNGKEP